MHALKLADTMLFLSTLSLRRATSEEDMILEEQIISIHALLAESDKLPAGDGFAHTVFLSTLSLRRATSILDYFSGVMRQFLSTLSLRRATSQNDGPSFSVHISIHALLAESDETIR